MLAISNLVRGDMKAAESFGHQLLARATQNTDSVAEVEGHYVLGVTFHWQGQFQKAHHHLRKAIDLYDKKAHNIHTAQFAQDPAVICRIRLALVLWHQGFPNEAQQLGKEVLQLSQQLAHPFSRAYALHWFAWLQNLQEDTAMTLEHARKSSEYSVRFQFPYFATQSRILEGWALSQQGEPSLGIQMMREGLSGFRATSSEVGCAYYRALIAKTMVAFNGEAQGRALIQGVMDSLNYSSENWSFPLILQMKAQILGGEQSCNNAHEIRQLLQNSMTFARDQGAVMDELRSAWLIKEFEIGTSKQEEATQHFNTLYKKLTEQRNPAEIARIQSLVEHWEQIDGSMHLS